MGINYQEIESNSVGNKIDYNMGLLFIPMFVVGIILMIKNPELLRKRFKRIHRIQENS